MNKRGILNVFTGQRATTEQASDMLNCWQIGVQSFETCEVPYFEATKYCYCTSLTQENTNNENRKAQEKKNKPKRKGFQTEDTVLASAIGMEQAQLTI